MPYDIDGRGIDRDENDGSILYAVLAFISVLLIIGAAWFVLSGEPREPAQEPPKSTLTLETGNAAIMHQYGLPTCADVMEWHVNGQWSYKAGGRCRVYADLPGDASAWDKLYGIDGGNPAFVR